MITACNEPTFMPGLEDMENVVDQLISADLMRSR
jgi:hypothetical protein